MLQNELWISHLLSRLARNGACPHYLQLHSCFRVGAAPPREWGDQKLLAQSDEAGDDKAVSASEEEAGCATVT